MKFDLANAVVRLVTTIVLSMACSALPAAETKDPFDADAILKHNRPWLHPNPKELESVAFKHSMEPIRFDERFVWRRDGASLIELTDSTHSATSVGERWVTTPHQQFFYIASQSKYATTKPLPNEGLDRYFRSHLMGTRCNFVALDWGWNPTAFAVPRLRRQPGGQLVAVVTPLGDRYRMNAGAMFHSSSSAYIHDLNVGSAELTIIEASHRILREVDYSPEGKVEWQIDFLDWHSTGKESEVPLRIRLRFARHKFEVDYRFQWRNEGLWILANSTSQFEGKAPQQEKITELAINKPASVLDDVLAQIDRSDQDLHADGMSPEQIAMVGVHSFELGKQAVLSKPDAQKPSPVRSLHFTLRPRSRLFEMGDIPDLIAEIGLPRATSLPDSNEQLLLTLLDKSGYPLRAVRAPLAALSVGDRPFGDVVQAVRRHNTLWHTEGRGISKPDVRLRQREAASNHGDEDLE
jgi:hypothetical protein